MIEDRRRRLAAEGLFAAERKRPLPFLPQTIGIVTSPTGAVIRDILHRLAERFPRHVLLWPVAVQGEAAAGQIAAAIAGFNAIQTGGRIPRPDLLIVARGGGSIEDLMAFNEEIVIRAAAASAIPLISAVGHETDTTLIDYASDKRAPTPTAAAEMAVPVRLDLLAEILSLGGRLGAGAARLLGERRLRVEAQARGLPAPRQIIENAAQRLDDRAERLGLAVEARLQNARASLINMRQRLRSPAQQIADHARQLDQTALRLAPAAVRRAERAAERLAHLTQLLESLSPYNVLERGYALVEDGSGRPLAAADIVPGMALNLHFADATLPARAEGGASVPPAPADPKPLAKKKREDLGPTRQSSLF
jgi:exodeoxyribonuclease VII large subunit